ncbi:phage tail protein [Vibrio metschnikovii]|uniref:phage tail-collar fiber domain-containing protein n=1 Tax=Vibrio metschnikovii TaxID=28172 RepID=UPI002FC7DEB3
MNELINSGVILTNRGQELIENAAATGRDIQLKQFGVGDGGSDAFNPTYDELKALTIVPGEWDRRNLNTIDPIQTGGYTVEGLVPHDVGEGRWVRIFGIYTTDNQLMYVFLYPFWQKPHNNGNLLIEVPFKASIGVSDSANFTLVIDPSLVAATQQFVRAQDKAHVDESHPHKQYALAGTHIISSEQSKVLKLGAVNVFTVPAEIPLPVADDGQWFVASVHSSVDLKTGECAFTAPDGETINHAGSAVPKTWFVATNQEFRFVRINGEWWV